MRGLMMRELRHEYIRAIQEEQQRTATLREDFDKHKGRVEEEVRADVEEAFGELAEWAREAAKADIGSGPLDSSAHRARGRSAGRQKLEGEQPSVFDAEPRREVQLLQRYI